MVKLIMLNKKIILSCVLLCGTLVYADPFQKNQQNDVVEFSENYQSFKINKKDRIQEVIETNLFGETKYNSVLVVTSSKGGTYFDYYFYKIDDENICLGIESYNSVQDDAVIYINTNKDCGTACKVYLDKPEEKQVFYIWEPLKKITNDNQKEKITIKTNKKNYSVYLRKGITDVELFFEEFPKVKSIKGLENFPELKNISFFGISS